jgi:hypothetical protein
MNWILHSVNAKWLDAQQRSKPNKENLTYKLHEPGKFPEYAAVPKSMEK